MAEVVNLQQSEYDAAIERLNELHSEVYDGIISLSDKVRTLSEVEGGFYIDQISAKIALLLDTLNTGIMVPMQSNMQLTEESMSSFAEMILNVDTACGL
ncbi:MAG: hypothetical protein J6B68_00445 [Lachnospiraceae bacterium]|nr:hypothetical protein [Lachnospiraceae bacterium]